MFNQPAIDKVYIKLCNDKRISVWHISLFMALFYLWKENGFENPISVTRKGIMALAHINSIATYHKCLKELQQYGYIDYKPSYNSYLGSKVMLRV